MVLPILLAWLMFAGQRANLYDTKFGVALLVLGNIACLTVLTMLVARSLHRLEREQERAEEALREDIAERARVERRLEESQKRVKGIIASAMDAIVTINDEHRITMFNAAAEKMFGFRERDAIGTHIERLIPQRFRVPHEVHIRKFGETGVTNRTMGFLGHVWGLRENGEEFPIEASISQLQADGEKLFTVIIRDVTDQMRAENVLRESEERFRLVANAAPVMIWLSGVDKLCNFFNRPWLDFTGRPLEAELGNGWTEGVHSEDIRQCLETYTKAFDRREPFQMEYRLRRHDGEYRWILDSGVPRFNADSSFAGYIGSCIDVTERKQAEEALRAREVQFRTLAEAIPQLCWMANPDGSIFWYNQRWYRYTGTTPEQMKGWGWESVHDPRTLSLVLERWKSSLATGEAFDMVFPLRGADGVFHPFLTRVMPVKDADGKVVRWFGTNTDVTELHNAQEALRASEERLRLAQQAARIGSFEWNVQTGVNTWTPELEKLYGLPPGAFSQTQEDFEDLIHPDDRAEVRTLVDQALETGQPTEGEWRVVWPDGSLHWLAGRWQVFRDESGKALRMTGVNLDLTERKRAEEALHEMNRALEAQTMALGAREELLRIFVEHVPAGVAMFDRDMRYLQASDRWCTDYGVDRSQVLGRSHYELFPDIPDRWREVHRRGLAGETVRANEDRWDRESDTKWIRWEVRPWWSRLDSLPGGLLIFAEDITHRKEMEDALRIANGKLIQAQEEERTRIARELHDDINQRLALLAIDLDSLRRRVPDSVAELRRWIGEASKQVVDLGSDVQALSHRLHSSKLEHLGLAKAAASFCRELANRRGMEIEFHADNVPEDLSKEISLSLFRVLQEALQNAIKYSGSRHFLVSLIRRSNDIQLTVRDSGIGFDPEQALKKHGLGLTSMKERLRLVKGDLSIDSKPQRGTTIQARVPLTHEMKVAAAVG